MSKRVVVEAETLMRQASMTSGIYYHADIKAIDAQFGEGCAREHPELVGAFVQTSAQDFFAAAIVRAPQEIEQTLRPSEKS